jgi:diacylglycerol kinase (ATP)
MTEELRESGRPAGLTRLWLATMNSRRGIQQCYRSEAAFRQEVWLACVLIPAGLWLGQNGVERVLLVGSMLLLIVIELLNTGIEVVVDRIGVERHPLSGFAKDVGSAAVFFGLVLLFSTWALIFWDRLF